MLAARLEVMKLQKPVLKPDNIPASLQVKDFWLVWKYEVPEGETRQTKVPYSVHGGHAMVNNPATWGSYESALAMYNAGGYDGLGICVSDGIAAVDIDHCIKDGELSEVAKDFATRMNCYMERSPSGEGLRLIFKAEGFNYDKTRYYLKNPHNGVEVYISGATHRYVTITGDMLFDGGVPDQAQEIDGLLEDYMVRPNFKDKPRVMSTQSIAPAKPATITGNALLDKINASEQGDAFRRLWTGDTSGHNNDDSAADMALCNMLAFWTNKNASQMDEMFRQSGLYRPKWDERRGGQTYGEMTIDRAIRDCASVYEGGLVVHEAKPTIPTQQTVDNYALVSLDTVMPEPPRYFWDPYIRLHNINVIRGDGGVGKTMFVMAIAAAVTNGRKAEGMPGVLNVDQGAVIYYGAEDDPSEYANRAVLCGCDRRYLHVISEGSMLPHLSDLSVFREQIQRIGAKLIVLDPIQSFLGAGTNMNHTHEVRPLLDGLRALCKEVGCTVIIIEHLNKATQQKAHYRGIGTVDIINACRSALMLGWHPEQRGISVAVHIKANAKYGQPVAYSIDDNGKFGWEGLADTTEDEVMNARRVKTTSPAQDIVDPVLALVLALMEKYPEGWTGTASQLLAEGSALVDCSRLTKAESIGKKLPGIHHELAKRGISWTKIKRDHSFSRRPQLTLVRSDNDGD